MFKSRQQKVAAVITLCILLLLIFLVVAVWVQNRFSAKLLSSDTYKQHSSVNIQLEQGAHYKVVQLAGKPEDPEFVNSLQQAIKQEKTSERTVFSLEESLFPFVKDATAQPGGFVLDGNSQQVLGYFNAPKEKYWLIKTVRQFTSGENNFFASTIDSHQFDPQRRWFFEHYPFPENAGTKYFFRISFRKYWLELDKDSDSPGAIVYNSKGKKIGTIAMRPVASETAKRRLYEGEFKPGLSRHRITVPAAFFAERFSVFGDSFTVHNEQGEQVADVTVLFPFGDSRDVETGVVSERQHTYPDKLLALQFLLGKPAVYFLENFYYTQDDDDLQGRDVMNVLFNSDVLLQEIYPYKIPIYLFPYEENVGVVYSNSLFLKERIFLNSGYYFPAFMSARSCENFYASLETKSLCGNTPMLSIFNDGTMFILQKAISPDQAAGKDGYAMLKINFNDYR